MPLYRDLASCNKSLQHWNKARCGQIRNIYKYIQNKILFEINHNSSVLEISLLVVTRVMSWKVRMALWEDENSFLVIPFVYFQRYIWTGWTLVFAFQLCIGRDPHDQPGTFGQQVRANKSSSLSFGQQDSQRAHCYRRHVLWVVFFWLILDCAMTTNKVTSHIL